MVSITKLFRGSYCASSAAPSNGYISYLSNFISFRAHYSLAPSPANNANNLNNTCPRESDVLNANADTNYGWNGVQEGSIDSVCLVYTEVFLARARSMDTKSSKFDAPPHSLLFPDYVAPRRCEYAFVCISIIYINASCRIDVKRVSGVAQIRASLVSKVCGQLRCSSAEARATQYKETICSLNYVYMA